MESSSNLRYEYKVWWKNKWDSSFEIKIYARIQEYNGESNWVLQ
jgi:hypothetical protein